MRRGLPLAMALLLVVAFSVALPIAQADDHGKPGKGPKKDKGKGGKPDGRENRDRDGKDRDDDHGRDAHRGEMIAAVGADEGASVSGRDVSLALPPVLASRGLNDATRSLDGAPTLLILIAIALAALVVVAAAAMVARWATKPRKEKPPRRTFDGGRARGVRDGMEAPPLAALEKSDLGEIVEATAVGSGHRIALRRGRGVSCEQAQGYLVGLFEAAWAQDARLDHPVCAGGDRHGACLYVVRPVRPIEEAAVSEPAPSRVIASGGRGAGASIRG